VFIWTVPQSIWGFSGKICKDFPWNYKK